MSIKASWSLNQWLSYLETLHPQSMELGLERITKVYESLGCPRPANKIISIAGTNGKGSVTAHITALAMAAGYSCGSHTSPHLLVFNERIQIDNKLVNDAEICQAFLEIEAARGEVSLSYFEFATLAAILILAAANLDLAIFEVGLGGRLDAVNILDADAVVVSSIAMDHQQWLGNDRDSIAVEKAGIFRSREQLQQALIIGDRDPPTALRQAVQASAQEAFYLGAEFDWQPSSTGITINCGNRKFDLPKSPLLAPIQNDNLAMAWRVLDAVLAADNLSNRLDKSVLDKLFNKIGLRGRLEKIASSPAVYVDVAHNPAAAGVLYQWLTSRPIKGKTWAVCAMLADKDHQEVLASVDKAVDAWFLAGLTGPRGQSAESLFASAQAGISKRVRKYDDVPLALNIAIELARADDRIIVFGSFLAVEQAIRSQNQ